MTKALYTIPESMTYSGLGKTSIYEALARGKLRGRKYGTRTLIEAESLHSFVASLPAANFKARRGREQEINLQAQE